MAPVSGVATRGNTNPYLGSGRFNVDGGRGRGNNVTVDGITATDVSVTGTGGALRTLNFSSVKDVEIITNNFTAEYGRNSSAHVIYITNGGTNELHGEAYEYLENDKLNARQFFDRSGHPNIIRLNTYGFEVGGRVYIPKLVRNKFFWHADYEGLKQHGAGATIVAHVPTPAQLASVTDPTWLALIQQYQIPSLASGNLPEAAPTPPTPGNIHSRRCGVGLEGNPVGELCGFRFACQLERSHVSQ